MRKLDLVVESTTRYFANKISGKPLHVSLEVTERCNADCDFYGYSRSNKDGTKVSEEIGVNFFRLTEGCAPA